MGCRRRKEKDMKQITMKMLWIGVVVVAGCASDKLLTPKTTVNADIPSPEPGTQAYYEQKIKGRYALDAGELLALPSATRTSRTLPSDVRLPGGLASPRWTEGRVLQVVSTNMIALGKAVTNASGAVTFPQDCLVKLNGRRPTPRVGDRFRAPTMRDGDYSCTVEVENTESPPSGSVISSTIKGYQSAAGFRELAEPTYEEYRQFYERDRQAAKVVDPIVFVERITNTPTAIVERPMPIGRPVPVAPASHRILGPAVSAGSPPGTAGSIRLPAPASAPLRPEPVESSIATTPRISDAPTSDDGRKEETGTFRATLSDFNPPSPSVLNHGDSVGYTIHYEIEEEGEFLIFTSPMYQGGSARPSSMTPSRRYRRGKGQTHGGWSIDRDAKVDQIRISFHQRSDGSASREPVKEIYVDVDYEFRDKSADVQPNPLYGTPTPAAPQPVAVPAATAQPAATLKVGDPAPALAQGKYVQGEPVAAFEKGKVYVVEFWATWCGPCRTVIPHVNKLQEKHRDKGLVVIGQNVWQRGENVEGDVTAFVKQMGGDMTYRVAFDREGAMSETWMKAAGRKGIPAAFVVDREGKIAWIGHPASGLDAAVEKALGGGSGE